MRANIRNQFTFAVDANRRVGEVSYDLIASVFAVSYEISSDVEPLLKVD